MKFKLSYIFNIFFRILLLFFLAFIWIRYFFDSLIISVILSIIISLTIDFLLQYFLNKKKYIKNLKLKEIEHIKSMENAFIFSDKKEVLNYFKNILNEYNPTILNDFVILSKDCDECLSPNFTFKKFSCDDLVVILKQAKKNNIKKLIICATSFENDCLKLSKQIDLDIILLDSQDTYEKYVKTSNNLPIQPFSFKKEKTQTLKDLFSNSFAITNAKKYFFLSVLIFFSSFFVRYNIYYLIASSILLILSLICLLKPKFKKKHT